MRTRPEGGDPVQVSAHAARACHRVREPRVQREGTVRHAAGDALSASLHICLQRRPRACCGRVTVVCLQLLDVPARPLHAGLQQRQRLKHLDKFSESDAGVLVATDVAARGLDIPDVRAVRHTRLPALHPRHMPPLTAFCCRWFTTTCLRAWTRTCIAAAARPGLPLMACRCVS